MLLSNAAKLPESVARVTLVVGPIEASTLLPKDRLRGPFAEERHAHAYRRAQAEAQASLAAEAQALGANAVIDLSESVSLPEEGRSRLVLRGLAVTVDA